MVLDPLIAAVIRLCIALLFLESFCHKSNDPRAFREAVMQYRVLPSRLVSVVAGVIVIVELLLAVSLPAVKVALPGYAAAALLTVYALAIGVNLRRGRRHIDCGCHGAARRAVPLSAYLFWRNLALAAAVLLSGTTLSDRALLWIDYLIVAMVVAALAFIYQSLELLQAHRFRVTEHSRLQRRLEAA